MREGRENGLLEINNKFVGINFGADYCAEHEWGIKGIRLDFDMQDGADGLEKRIIHSAPLTSRYRSLAEIKAADGSFRGFEYCADHPDPIVPKERPATGKSKKRLNFREEPIKLWTAWDEGSFGVVSDHATTREKLRVVYDAIMKLDAAIWLGGGGAFQNAGFVIAIASELPKHVTDAWRDADMDKKKLVQDAEATGILHELCAAGKTWYSLSPRREKDGTIVFWLNPMEQRIHNHGWYTVEQLRRWARDEGPVMNEQNAAK